jgi:hypothetical protein
VNLIDLAHCDVFLGDVFLGEVFLGEVFLAHPQYWSGGVF